MLKYFKEKKDHYYYYRSESCSMDKNMNLNMYFNYLWFEKNYLFNFSNIKNRSLIHLVFMFLIVRYRAIRHLLGLPVAGQRTWTNAYTSKKLNKTLLNFKVNQNLDKQQKPNKQGDLKKLIIFTFINKIWKIYWFLYFLFLYKKNKSSSKRFNYRKIAKQLDYKKIYDWIGI